MSLSERQFEKVNDPDEWNRKMACCQRQNSSAISQLSSRSLALNSSKSPFAMHDEDDDQDTCAEVLYPSDPHS